MKKGENLHIPSHRYRNDNWDKGYDETFKPKKKKHNVKGWGITKGGMSTVSGNKSQTKRG